jgi:aminopeptidase N
VIFKQHEQAITYFENYTLFKFPFQKLDFAAIPSHQYGGMEHVGAIQYQESDLFLDTTATRNEKLNRAKLIAHETAHMWFGNLVTMKWFDDVWMKEVFANFMADKMVNPLFPEINHHLEFLVSHYPSAYSEDRTSGTNPIKQNLENLKNAGSQYGAIIYDKAPIMMRQLELSMGEKLFKKGVQKYIRKYANSNADWNDLIKILDKKIPLDLEAWSKVWVNQPGRPIISETIKYDDSNTIETFYINQKAEDGSNNYWQQNFELGLVYPNEIKIIKVALKGESTSVQEAVGLPKPQNIIFNYDGYGYGVFPFTPIGLNGVCNIKNELARASSYINLYENALIGKITPSDAINTFINGISTEPNELIVETLTAQISSVFWKYLTEKQQQTAQKAITKILYQRLQENASPNIKKTVFGLYANLAYTVQEKDVLYQIWNKELEINDLKLNEEDFTSIAMDLIIFKHQKTNEIIAKTLTSISNPDRKKRFEYLLASLSEDESILHTFMESLKEEKNRKNESWVLSAFRNIFHPLRQESSKKYLSQTLNLIEEIQRTGDIFFPKAWIGSSIGRFSSAYAFNQLQVFLKENPNFSPILKRKLMQATDGLCRAQKIKKDTE